MEDNERHLYDRFDSLITRHGGLIDRLCMRHAFGDVNRCAELRQDCYISLWHYLPGLRIGAAHTVSSRSTTTWPTPSASRTTVTCTTPSIPSPPSSRPTNDRPSTSWPKATPPKTWPSNSVSNTAAPSCFATASSRNSVLTSKNKRIIATEYKKNSKHKT